MALKKIKTVNVHAGHTAQSGKSPGASGVVNESVENRKIKTELIKILKKRGIKVYDCTAAGKDASNNLYRIVTKCNRHKVDLDISIHLNCFNGKAKGTETLVYSNENKVSAPYAKKICSMIKKRGGFVNRGVKERPELYVIRKTNAPALLVETFFCDSKSDYKLYKEMGGAKGMAKAIADAICPVKKRKQ